MARDGGGRYSALSRATGADTSTVGPTISGCGVYACIADAADDGPAVRAVPVSDGGRRAGGPCPATPDRRRAAELAGANGQQLPQWAGRRDWVARAVGSAPCSARSPPPATSRRCARAARCRG